MIWGLLAFASACLLGIYDIFKKSSLKENAVLPVLFFSTLTSGLFFIVFVLISKLNPELETSFPLFVKSMPVQAHLFFFCKTCIVASSWILSYFAVKHLPITLVGPIRSSSPLWTILGAYIIFAERLCFWQWVGVSVTLLFYYLFSFIGKKEGFVFRKNKWVLFLVFATLIASMSALYDKFLVAHFDKIAIQAWYQIYMIPLMSIVLLVFWWPKKSELTVFKWRYTIPLIGLTLTLSDLFYFRSLASDGALITIVATIRRANVLVSFSVGAYLFKEKNLLIKALCMIGLLVGIGILVMGK